MRFLQVIAGLTCLISAAGCLPEADVGPDATVLEWPDAHTDPDAGPDDVASPDAAPTGLDCHPGFDETDGECVLDRTSYWTVSLLSAAAPPLDPDGEAWDNLGGDPDLFVRVIYGADKTVADSSPVWDSLWPVWGEGEPIMARVSVADLKSLFDLELRDEDGINFDDSVGRCAIELPDSIFDGEAHSLDDLDAGCPHVTLQMILAQ